MADTPDADHYDVVVLGGAFSGSSLGLLLIRERPDLRILIIEKSTKFDRKVGESTSEVAGCFLTRILGLSNHLAGRHFQKHGLRLWFNEEGNECPNRCSEIGPFAQARFPTYQLDREILDQYLLDQSAKEGCEVVRPATIKSFELDGVDKNTVTYKQDGVTRTVTAKWVADCSGKAALIARKRGTLKTLDSHPVHSMWVRFRNVRCLDSNEARTMAPSLQDGPFVPRGCATNHLMGHGWWCWIIPLSNGDFSAGITWDERLFTPPSDGQVGQRLKEHLLSHPIGKLMFEDAEPIENDARSYKYLPYYSSEVCGDGWISMGDSAGFMDPLYSQGLDYCAHATYSSHRIILSSLSGECVKERVSKHDKQYRQSYQRWYKSLYHNKYQYIGDSELMRAAFLMDLATYFMGPVQLVYKYTDKEFSQMPYFGFFGGLFAKFMSFYNRRLEVVARKRLRNGTYARNNLDHSYFLRKSFEGSPLAAGHLFRGVRTWIKLEIQNAFTRPAPDFAEAVAQADSMRESSSDMVSKAEMPPTETTPSASETVLGTAK
ncbi:NAD(P)/FAD-dependent oxidoreductase [Haloferula sp.]|uniref:NAD(P)/FAD-dependent oxidoreductase n=1 Tax=Haloferula sp. TaxID=2497595 RepID=UPI0032A061E3